MKKLLAIVALVGMGFWLGSCGSRTLAEQPTTGVSSGNWEATLTGGLGEASKLDFVVNFTVPSTTNGGTLDITSLSFFNVDSNACFISVSGASGSTILTTNNVNQVTGSMIISISSANPSGNTLTLSTTAGNGLPGGQVSGTSSNGTLSNGAVTGNWTLTNPNNNSACTGSGTFLMCQGAATCTPTNT